MVMVMYGRKMCNDLQRGNAEHTVVVLNSRGGLPLSCSSMQECIAKSEDNLRSQTYLATIGAQIAQALLSLMHMQQVGMRSRGFVVLLC
jgi:hypothetical protein